MKSKYKSYPSYKDSGVEWLGEIPEGWTVVSMKWISYIYAGGTPDKTNLSYWTDGTVPWINSGEVNQFYITKPTTYITEEAYANSSAKWIEKGSLVMALAGQGKTKGMVAQLGIRTTCNQSMAAIETNKVYESKFLLWWITANYQNIRNMAGGNLRDGLNLDLLGNIPCPFMSQEEQKAIATYLDRATQKIDSLIAKQSSLIALLKEKRQAVISTAVTRGLDSTVAMKDSGVEWLGEIPEHWIKVAIKRISSVGRGASPRPIDDIKYFDDNGEYSWVRIADVSKSNGYLNKTKQKLSKLGSSLSVKMHPNDLFVSIAGTVGKPCITNIKACIHDGFVHFPQLPTKYIKLLYRIFEAGECYGGLGKMGTQLNLNTETIGAIHISIAPDKELSVILDYIDEKTSKIDTLITKATKAIDLLKEKRTALISAAVTGKIDVRNTSEKDNECQDG